MKTMYEHAVDWIRRNAGNHGDSAELMRQAKAAKPSWYKLLQGKDVRAESLMAWLENLGFRLLAPDGETIPAGAGLPAQAEGAAPGAEESGARQKRRTAESKRVAELEAQLTLLRELYDKSLLELTELKAANRHLRGMSGLDGQSKGEADGLYREILDATANVRAEARRTLRVIGRNKDEADGPAQDLSADADYGLAQEEPAGYGSKGAGDKKKAGRGVAKA